uniref:Uncharacterized protein n=1 Tax=Cacopsylla melanoneura TaxID=428564 RepID=A0A8D8ZFH7_9HEMI
MMCENLYGLPVYLKLDRQSLSAQIDKSSLISKNCNENSMDCINTVTYRSYIPIYPCKNILIKKMNNDTEILLINKVDTTINVEEYLFFIPNLSQSQAELKCGMNYNIDDEKCTQDYQCYAITLIIERNRIRMVNFLKMKNSGNT